MTQSGYQEITSSNQYFVNLKTQEIDAALDPAYAEWQFRISLLPISDNLKLAQEAFREFIISNYLPSASAEENLRKYPLPFRSKILALDEDITNTPWDPSFADQGTDRNQMGKELCLYMPFYFDKNKRPKNVYSVSEWKDLMLKIIAAMQAKEVQFGQGGIPFGDKGILTTEGFRLPVTYTSFKPYQNRWGILHEGNYNPHSEHLKNDPLSGLSISVEDLKKYKIDAEKLFMGIDVLANLQLMYRRKIKDFVIKTQQIADSTISIDTQIIKIKGLGNEIMSLLNTNTNIIKNKCRTLYQEIKTLQDIDASLPQRSPSIMSPDGSVAVSKKSQLLMNALNTIFYKGDNGEFHLILENISDFTEAWSEIIKNLHKEIDMTLATEYEQVLPELLAIFESDGVEGLINNNNILYKDYKITILNDSLDKTIAKLIETQPRKMQCLYTLLIHAIHDYLYYKMRMEIDAALTQKLFLAIKDVSPSSVVYQNITSFISLLKKGNPIAISYFLTIDLDHAASVEKTTLFFSKFFNKPASSEVIQKALIESLAEASLKDNNIKRPKLGS